MWENSDIPELLKQGKTIQRNCKEQDDRKEAKTSCRFSKLMMKERVRAAL